MDGRTDGWIDGWMRQSSKWNSVLACAWEINLFDQPSDDRVHSGLHYHSYRAHGHNAVRIATNKQTLQSNQLYLACPLGGNGHNRMRIFRGSTVALMDAHWTMAVHIGGGKA